MKRLLGPFDCAALVISNVIGVGIFTTPGIVAGMVHDPVAFLGVWILGGIFALIGVLAYAELAYILPRSGGEYIFINKAFGPLAGFLAGWTSFVAGFSGAIAAAAVGFAAYLGRFFPMITDAKNIVSISLIIIDVSISVQTLTALAIIFFISAIHFFGVNAGRHFQNYLAGGCLLAIAVLVIFGFGMGRGSFDNLSVSVIDFNPSAWLSAMIPIVFTYSGWNAAVYVVGEVRDPKTNLIKALLLGIVLVIIVYFVLNLLFLYALPLNKFANIIEVGDVVAEVLFGTTGAVLLTIVILLALASSVSAMVMTGSRIYYAMAQDGLFPGFVGKLHPRFSTPATAIVIQSCWSAILILTGTFEDILIYTGFSILLFAAIAVIALFRLRKTMLADTMAIKYFGNRVLPAIFVGFSFLIALNSIYANPVPSGAGLLVICTGIPIYFWIQKRNK